MNQSHRWSLLLFSVAFAACSAVTQIPAMPTTQTGKITFAGSTTVQPLVAKLAAVYQQSHPGITMDIAAGGTLVGIQAIHDGTVDIGMASRELTLEEAQGVSEFHIADDVIAIVVNPGNPVGGLALADLADIYFGVKTNWSAFGGPDLPIRPITRESTSGTRGAFDEMVLQKKEPTAAALETAVTAGDVVAGVAAEDGAIGYIGFGNMDPSVRILAVDGVVPSRATVQDKSYRLVRPLNLLIGPLTQPIANEFIVFILSPEGQQLIESYGWIPVS